MPFDETPRPFHPNRPLLMSPVRLDAAGEAGPTRHQAKSKRWRQTSHGLYVPSTVDDDVVDQRIVEAAATVGPKGGAVTGWAALRWLRARWFDGLRADGARRPVDLAVAGSVRRNRPGVRVCEEGLRPDQVVVVDGLAITIPVRSVAFMMRHAPNDLAAVEAFDMAAYDDLVSWHEMTDYAGMAPRLGLSSWFGMPRYRRAMHLADENSWSPREVWMRVTWVVDAGLPRPLVNRPLFDRAGRHLGTPDLLDLEAGVVGEYDGRLHLADGQRADDRTRMEAFRDVGLEAFTVFAGDAYDLDGVVQRMHAARSRARWQLPDQRGWTVEPPEWWTPTVTVAMRRALSEDQQERFLAYRRAA